MAELPFLLFDADNHYYEAEDAFTRHIDPRMKKRCMNWAELNGRRELLVAGNKIGEMLNTEMTHGWPNDADAPLKLRDALFDLLSHLLKWQAHEAARAEAQRESGDAGWPHVNERDGEKASMKFAADALAKIRKLFQVLGKALLMDEKELEGHLDLNTRATMYTISSPVNAAKLGDQEKTRQRTSCSRFSFGAMGASARRLRLSKRETTTRPDSPQLEEEPEFEREFEDEANARKARPGRVGSKNRRMSAEAQRVLAGGPSSPSGRSASPGSGREGDSSPEPFASDDDRSSATGGRAVPARVVGRSSVRPRLNLPDDAITSAEDVPLNQSPQTDRSSEQKRVITRRGSARAMQRAEGEGAQTDRTGERASRRSFMAAFGGGKAVPARVDAAAGERRRSQMPRNRIGADLDQRTDAQLAAAHRGDIHRRFSV